MFWSLRSFWRWNSGWRWLDPRLSLATAIGWVVVGVVSAAAGWAASVAATEVEQRARADAEALLEEAATQVRDAASMTLGMRSGLLQVVALQLNVLEGNSSGSVHQALLAVHDRFTEFEHLAVLDTRGQVLDATGRHSVMREVPRQAWWPEAAQGLVVSDAEARPQVGPQASQPRVLVMALPLGRNEGGLGRVLVASLPWVWFEAVLERMQDHLGRAQDRVELLLAARDGTVLMGPPAWLGRSIKDPVDLTDQGRYVVGQRAQLRLADSLGLGWTVVVRQKADVALASAQAVRRTVFVTVLLAGVCSALVAVAATRLLTRRLQRLSQAAEQVRQGTCEVLVAPKGRDEVAAIGATLAQVVEHLQAEKRALKTLNAELDQRVLARTARIERMSSEARAAAVSRERLRLARDLHDTLAHSLMALLTQLRLIHKLHSRMTVQTLEAELECAEEVAAAGLKEARAAIAQMRNNSVREAGFGSALRDLLHRFGQRTGLPVQLEVTPEADGWLDDKFEAVFRIVEEALRNIERHAGASQVDVVVRVHRSGGSKAADEVLIQVRDDGCGFDPELPQPGHFGLRGMREQAGLIEACLQVDSQIGHGVCVTIGLSL